MFLPNEGLASWLRERLARGGDSLASDLSAPLARRAAAVLVGFVPRQDGVTILLTRRAAHLPAHPGQVCFPGGAREAHDADLIATALRESHED